jgi:hypothetical protein
MKKRDFLKIGMLIILLGLFITVTFQHTFSQKSVSEKTSFDYFGQIPPKDFISFIGMLKIQSG